MPMQSNPTHSPSELHHRYHEQLLAYWNSLRGGRAFPSESELDPDEISELWPSCFLVSIDDVTKRLGYRYSYLGNDLIEAYGDDTNSPDVMLRLLATNSTALIHKLDEVIKTRKPVIDESEFVNIKHFRIRYRTCMLPLGYEDDQVSHIIGCMRWKMY